MTMDCEKFEPLLIDARFEKLDAITRAALEEHVKGCARCASIVDGLRAPQRDAARADAASATRLSHWLSLAGNWAMRPQTAMAAVFLLMIGTSAFLIRTKIDKRSAPVSVIVAGSPGAKSDESPSASAESLDDKVAAAAHGPVLARSAAATGANREGASPKVLDAAERDEGDPVGSSDDDSPPAALAKADSMRDRQGCAAALALYIELGKREAGTFVGDEASMRAARCELGLGKIDAARTRLEALARSGTHQEAAQTALAELERAPGRKPSDATH